MDIISYALALKKAKAYTDTSVGALPKGLVYKGTVAAVGDLPVSGNTKGDLYTVTANGHEYIWTIDSATGAASNWLDLSADLNGKVAYDRVETITGGGGRMTMPSAYKWEHVSEANNKLWATQYESKQTAAVSDDGINWTNTLLRSGYNGPVKIVYGNGVYLAVFNGPTGLTSTDGINWNNDANFGSSSSWKDCIFVDGTFYLLEYGWGVWTSTDAKTWTQHGFPEYHYGYTSLAYGGGRFVAVGNNSAYSYYSKPVYSDDGLTWSYGTITRNWEMRSVAYGNGTFVAVGPNIIFQSADGITWTETLIDGNWYQVAFGNGKFVAIDFNGRIAYSTDGKTWTIATTAISRNWYSVGFGCGKFVALPYDSADGLYSFDGINWTTHTGYFTYTLKDCDDNTIDREVTSNKVTSLSSESTDVEYPSAKCVKDAIDSAASIPSGVIVMWSGAANAIPSGWYLCDGNNGTPNLVDRFVIGAGSTYAVGATGGEATHTLTVDEMPSHSHDMNYSFGGTSGSYCNMYVSLADTRNTYSGIVVNTGGGAAHNNLPPYYALCYIMKG